ncbi:MAG TPA: hypothetical protein VGK32_07555 [Vicinamibacterales bacterium]|jgi:hypothetical protein
MSIKRLISYAALAAFTVVGPTWAATSPLELPVRTGHMRHGSRGTLVFGDQGVEYKTSKKDAGHRWTYEEIKQVQVLSPTRLAVRTYEDQGWTRLWVDRTVEFEIEKGAVSPELSAFLLAKIPRPVMTSILPAMTRAPRYRVPVKHVRGRRGSDGDLALYDDALVYTSAQAGASRYWRFGDLASVYAPDRFRLEVLTYEGGGGDTRPFTFQLKADLPPGFYDTLWTFLNAPPPLRQSTGR